MGLDGLDAADYTGVAREWCAGVWRPDPVVGIWRTRDETSFWIFCIVLETPQAGRPGLEKSTFLF